MVSADVFHSCTSLQLSWAFFGSGSPVSFPEITQEKGNDAEFSIFLFHHHHGLLGHTQFLYTLRPDLVICRSVSLILPSVS